MKTVLRSILLAAAAASIFHFAAAAQDANEAAAWTPIQGSASAEQLKAFLDAYPAGTHAREARQKYSMLASTKLDPAVQTIDVDFPNQARRIGRSIGAMRVVTLTIQVQQDGKATDVDVAKSSGFDLYDKAAMSAARSATYLPAMDHGVAVDGRMNYEVSFGLLCNRAASASVNCDDGRFPQKCSATVCALLLR
jgi:TonB family protein